MKFLITIFVFHFFSIQIGHAQDFSFQVLKRNSHDLGVHISDEKLENLISNDSFEGKYFKIVLGKDNKAIPFEFPEKNIIFKAATVYYHLTQARNFWIHKINSPFTPTLAQIVVRLDLTNLYDDLGQFAHDNRNPQYNNALSIPSGRSPEWIPEDRQRFWGPEIWFRPKKKISSKEFPVIGDNPIESSLLAIKEPLFDFANNNFQQQLLQRLFYPTQNRISLFKLGTELVGTYALFQAMMIAAKKADPLFLEKWYYLETALVPEVIYHEYAHINLSETLTMTHSTPVNEGLADFFTAAQSQKNKIYARVMGQSNAASKNAKNKKVYQHWDESNRSATGDFTLSVLWDVRKTLGAQIGDQVIFGARKYLTTQNSTLSHGLIRAILISCQETCHNPVQDKLKLYETFSKRGF